MQKHSVHTYRCWDRVLPLIMVLLAAIFMIVAFPFPVSAEETVILSGTCGNNLTWTFDKTTGTLVVSGAGAMELFPDEFWLDYKDMVVSAVLEEGVTGIGKDVFFGFEGLTDITIPNSVTSIGDCAFQDCIALKSIAIPSSVTSIGKYAFAFCDALTGIVIPYGVTSIRYGTFWSCKHLTSAIIPDSVTDIEASAFGNCHSLASITIPDSVVSMGIGAFSGCWPLESVTIPSSMTSLELDVFLGCHSLKSITIPESVTSIEESMYFGPDFGLTIYGFSGSYAKTFALTNNFSFVQLNQCTDGEHSGEWITITEPTCVAEGSEQRVCIFCGKIETRMIEVLGHDYSPEWTVDVTATENIPGSKSHHCIRCDERSDVTEIPATVKSLTRNSEDWYDFAVQYALANGLSHDNGADSFAVAAAADRAMLLSVLRRREEKCTAADFYNLVVGAAGWKNYRNVRFLPLCNRHFYV